jgi:hypothetical protein
MNKNIYAENITCFDHNHTWNLSDQNIYDIFRIYIFINLFFIFIYF